MSVQGSAKLVIDLGNSETRVATLYGKNSKGRPKTRLTELSNRYAVVPDDQVQNLLNSPNYNEENSRMFKYHDSVYSNGAICDIEYNSVSLRPSALEPKYSSMVTSLTIMNCLRQGYEDVALLTNSDLEGVDITWDIVMLLPPENIDVGASKLAQLARDIKNIDFLMPELEKDIKINKIDIYPEGFCALIAVLFEDKGKIRNNYKHLADPEELTLIVDIGAGTTDFVMAQGAKIINSSRFTKNIGGNNVHRIVQKYLRQRGVSLPDKVVQKGCEVGFVKSGAKKYDITEEINAAKQEVSRQLVDAIQEFFEASMISLDTITNLLVCGGGAESNPDVQGISPIADYIVDYMKRLAPSISLVATPYEADEKGIETKISSRLLNIKGAMILAS